MIRAPRPSDMIWFVLLAFAIMAIRMIFASDPPVLCPEGTACYDAGTVTVDQ